MGTLPWVSRFRWSPWDSGEMVTLRYFLQGRPKAPDSSVEELVSQPQKYSRKVGAWPGPVHGETGSQVPSSPAHVAPCTHREQ